MRELTLIDQDHDALSHAYEQTLPEVMRLRGRASVNCLHTSFLQLMKADSVFSKLQDLIYTVGLVDYLSQRRGKALASALYASLAPGGTLIIGNMFETPKGNLWPMEFVCDWNIVYRSEAEMTTNSARRELEDLTRQKNAVTSQLGQMLSGLAGIVPGQPGPQQQGGQPG